jgi:putative Holliday junction resolvase
MRILAIDPGEKNIGIAVSDPSGAVANPLIVLRHVSRQLDAAVIAQIAREQQVEQIIVGQALDDDGLPSPQGRRAARLAAAIRTQCDLPVELWDESFSTHAASEALIALGTPRSKRKGHHDDIAATYILQTYLDANPSSRKTANDS